MARNAGELTVAIRTLLDQHNGELTHADIRPLLVKQGFEVAPEPPKKSSEFDKFNEYQTDLNDKSSIEATLKACGFEGSVAKAVVAEAKARKAFKDESNNYNVVKYNWQKSRDSRTTTVSRKPGTSRNSKAKAAAKATRPVPKHRATTTTVAMSNDNALELVKSEGGVAKVQAKIASMQAEIASLEAAVTTVLELQKAVAAAA